MSIKLKQIIIIVIVLVVSALLAVGIASGEQKYMNYLAQIFVGSSDAYPPPVELSPTQTERSKPQPVSATATPQPVSTPVEKLPTNEPEPARSTATEREARGYPKPRYTPFETPVEVTP